MGGHVLKDTARGFVVHALVLGDALVRQEPQLEEVFEKAVPQRAQRHLGCKVDDPHPHTQTQRKVVVTIH